MSPEVAVTSWAVWSAGGVSVNEAPVVAEGRGLAPWPNRPASLIPPRGRPVPASASALVQLVQGVLSNRRARRVPAPPTTIDLRLGTRTGSEEIDLAFRRSLADRGDAFGSPSLFAYTLSTAAGGEVSLALGLRGALSTVSCGEVSGLAALVTGAAAVASGRSEACLCGAMDVSGSDSDAIALFLLEASRPGLAAPRLVGWNLSFDSEAMTGPTSDSVRSTMERLAVSLATGESAAIGASSSGGHSALLSIVRAARRAVRPRRPARVGRG